MSNKVYSSYAFSENESEKAKSNKELYNELIKKYKVKSVRSGTYPTKEELEQNDFVYSVSVRYGRWECRIYKAVKELSTDEQALIIDGDNLCFGHCVHGNEITIFTD